ncbi:MAG: hypothetical protein R3185_06100 [Candidatus Thermoplasmatota archaeon]|nr:hypothetical protein [Candidatus Thermoplasmatota archaeon]
MRKAKTTLGGKAHENLHEYMTGLMAAVRTHQRLSGKRELRVEIQPRGRLPLAQSLLLR